MLAFLLLVFALVYVAWCCCCAADEAEVRINGDNAYEVVCEGSIVVNGDNKGRLHSRGGNITVRGDNHGVLKAPHGSMNVLGDNYAELDFSEEVSE